MNNYFIAVNIPGDISEKIYSEIKNKKFEDVLAGKFISLDQYHLTLRFFGEIEDWQIIDFEKKLENLKFKKFNCSVNEIGFFNTSKDGGVIWVGMVSHELNKLVSEIWKFVGSEKRKFKPHMTVFRFKKILDSNELNKKIKNFKFEGLSFSVKKFYLMKSTLLKEGSKYEVLKEYSLQN